MTTQERLLDVLKRQKFLQADTQRLHDLLVEQGFRTEEQTAEIEMLKSIADDIEAEVAVLMSATPKPPLKTVYTCQHCGKPTQRVAGRWMHVESSDFAKCGRAGVPRGGGAI